MAAHWVLADTTYAAAEDPALVMARRAAHATPQFAAELAMSSPGSARLEQLRAREARYDGEVLAIATADETPQLALVDVTAAVTLATVDAPPERQVHYYRLTLGRDSLDAPWLVARVERS